MKNHKLLLTAAASALAFLAACGSKEPPPAPATSASGTAADAPAPVATTAPAQSPPAASTSNPVTTPKPAAKPSATKPAAPTPKPVQVVTIPAGTELQLSLAEALSSKTAKVGDPVSAVITSAVMVDGKTALGVGTKVAGSVIKVVSGSDKIGGTPTLGITFDRVELPGGADVPISGTLTQQGKSNNTRDTVKIVGGTAAGAIIGDKVIKGKKGKFIGGLLGGAVGAVAAQKTGTEVQIEEGTNFAVALDAPVEITK
jgi:hypothetical protein